MLNPDCVLMGDHDWRGTGACVSCGARLRCFCGVFVTESGMDAHLERCRVLLALPRTLEGATEVRAKREDAWNGLLVQGSIPDPGRYLILPLEDTPK